MEDIPPGEFSPTRDSSFPSLRRRRRRRTSLRLELVVSRRRDVGREENGKREQGSTRRTRTRDTIARSFGWIGRDREQKVCEWKSRWLVAKKRREKERKRINIGKEVEGVKRTKRLGREGGWRRGRKKEYMKRGERWGEGGIGELFRQARSQWRWRGRRGCKESAREKTGEAGEAGEPGETGEIGGASGSLGGRNRRPGQCKPGSLPDDIVALDIAVILLFFFLSPILRQESDLLHREFSFSRSNNAGMRIVSFSSHRETRIYKAHLVPWN